MYINIYIFFSIFWWRQRRHLFGQLKRLCKFDPFQMAVYLAARSVAQPLPCLLNISLCFSVSKAHLGVGGSSLLRQLPVSQSKLGNNFWCLAEKVHIIQKMYLFKKRILPYKDVSSFAIEAEKQSEETRHWESQHSSIAGSVIDWLCVLGVLCKLPEPRFTFHKWDHQQYLPHKAGVNVKCSDSCKGWSSTVLDS